MAVPLWRFKMTKIKTLRTDGLAGGPRGPKNIFDHVVKGDHLVDLVDSLKSPMRNVGSLSAS